MRRSLLELDMGLKGDLSISEAMETLMGALFSDATPDTWSAFAWPSLRPLASWLGDMLARWCFPCYTCPLPLRAAHTPRGSALQT